MARLAHTKNCIFCGHEVRRPRQYEADVSELDWRQRYRIIYRDLQFVTGISGLASHRDSRGRSWYAPWARDDTQEYSGITNMPENESICVMDCYSSGNYSRYGFPAHQNCWLLLQKAYSPNPIPYETLFNVCKSFEGPQPDRILDWGHDYGGALRVTYGNRIEGRNVDDRRDTPDFFDRDPCSPEDVEGLLIRSSQTSPLVASFSSAQITSNDCLSLLSSDVRLLIADLLPIVDFYALRLASRSFYFIFHQQSFWARRFAPGGDRDWLFEVPDIIKKQEIDWRSLYKITNDPERLPPSMRNRVRIWNFVKLIKDATPLSPIQSITNPSISTPDCEFDIWTSVTCHVPDSQPLFPESDDSPKVKLPRQRFQLPGSLEEIKVYFIRLGPVTFISGITFLMTSGRSRHIGYKSGSGRRLKLSEDPIGFNLGLESQGILSIQAVYSDGNMSEWLGDDLDMSVTRRLVLHDKITAVEGVFDGCKLIGFSLSRHPPKTTVEVEEMRKRRSSVFHSGIWYPEMPDITKNIHEKFAKLPYQFYPTLEGEVVGGSRYVPIWFTRFGDKDGPLLESLSGVRGELSDAIIFSYESNDVSQPEQSWPTGYGYRAMRHPPFGIDGKGGERFVKARLTIEVVDPKPDQDPFVYGELNSAALITNRGRECALFSYELQYNGDLITTEIELDDSELITGIYGVPGGMSLGIVSEKISNDS